MIPRSARSFSPAVDRDRFFAERSKGVLFLSLLSWSCSSSPSSSSFSLSASASCQTLPEYQSGDGLMIYVVYLIVSSKAKEPGSGLLRFPPLELHDCPLSVDQRKPLRHEGGYLGSTAWFSCGGGYIWIKTISITIGTMNRSFWGLTGLLTPRKSVRYWAIPLPHSSPRQTSGRWYRRCSSRQPHAGRIRYCLTWSGRFSMLSAHP